VALSVAVFLVIGGITLFLEIFAVVVIAGEVSCYQVCSPTWAFLERFSPLPAIVGWSVAIGAGWGASRLVVPTRPPRARAH